MISHKGDRAEANLKRSLLFIRLFHHPIAAWVILFLSLSMTVFAYFLSTSFVHNRAQDRFSFQSKEIEELILNRLKVYEQALWGGVGLFNASHNGVTREEFKKYVDTLEINTHWPGIQGLGFSVPITPEQKVQHESQIRSQGFPDYKVVPEGERDFYTSIVYLEPFDWRNKRAFGYDMWSNTLRREAMMRARDTGIAAMSGMITLVQETDEDIQKGFLTYLPVYRTQRALMTVEQRREDLIGWVYAPFRAGNLMNGIIDEKDPNIEFEIFDGNTVSRESLLFDSNNEFHLYDKNHLPKFSTISYIESQGRPWLVYFNTPTNFDIGGESYLPRFVALAGTFIDLLLFYIVYSLYLLNRQTHLLTKERRLIIEQQPNALILMDQNGNILMANAQAGITFCYEQDELTGKNVKCLIADFELVGDSILEPTDSTGKANRDNRNESLNDRETLCGIELNGLRKDGVAFPIRLSLSRIERHQGYSLIASIIDISDSKRVEREWQEINAALERKNQEMEQFIYTVSHDLKSPLVTIGGFANKLQVELDNVLTEKQMHRFDRVISNVNYMETLLNDLLRLSRVIRQDIDKRSIDLLGVIENVCSTLEEEIFSSNAEIELKQPLAPIFANERLLLQCFQNLLSNAIKYREPSRQLTIVIESLLHKEYSEVIISDNGIGIEAKYHEQVFRIFERLDVGEGTGVGLTIVKTIVDKHGGYIEMDSLFGEGTSFHLFFKNRE